MNHVDFLDRVLLWLSETESFTITKDIVSVFSNEENEFIPQAVRKLEKDGYVYSIGLPSRSEFKISFDGKLALVNVPDKFKNKPYQYKLHKETISQRNDLINNIAVVANAVIALILSFAALFTK